MKKLSLISQIILLVLLYYSLRGVFGNTNLVLNIYILLILYMFKFDFPKSAMLFFGLAMGGLVFGSFVEADHYMSFMYIFLIMNTVKYLLTPFSQHLLKYINGK